MTSPRRHPSRHPPSIPTPSMYRRFVGMMADRFTLGDIAGELSIAPSTLRKWCARFGIKPMTRAEGRAASMARRA
jgi:hypothetical protein